MLIRDACPQLLAAALTATGDGLRTHSRASRQSQDAPAQRSRAKMPDRSLENAAQTGGTAETTLGENRIVREDSKHRQATCNRAGGRCVETAGGDKSSKCFRAAGIRSRTTDKRAGVIRDGIIIWQTPDDAKVPFLLKLNNNTQVRYLNTLDSRRDVHRPSGQCPRVSYDATTLRSTARCSFSAATSSTRG